MPFVDPPKLRILKGMANTIATRVDGTNGYRTDLSGVGRVQRGRLLFGEDDPVPMVSILEVPLPLDLLVSQEDKPSGVGPWELVLQGWIDEDKDNPTDPAHVLMADVMRALETEKREAPSQNYYFFGERGIVTDIRIGSGVVRPPDDVSDKANFYLNVTVDMCIDLHDPYGEL